MGQLGVVKRILLASVAFCATLKCRTMKDKRQLYPTAKEERRFRELKARYGLKDDMVAKGLPDKKKQKDS